MKAAIIQDGPVYLDAQATLDKTIAYIEKAKSQGADLVVFGENWFSGYPIWLDICKDVNIWDHPPVKEVWRRTFEEGLASQGALMTAIQKAISSHELFVVMGANEPISSGKGNGTIYNTIYTFAPDGSILNHHRKLMPTYTEKLVHGLGDGAGLKALDTPFGRLGSLICWEHWMPLTRQAMHDEGEDLHIALWPFAKELHQLASRHYAHEGRCHVIAVGQVMHQSELPDELDISDSIDVSDDGLILRGGCAVYGPDGKVILPPSYDERLMHMVDLDLKSAIGERMNLSVSGHYQRDDVFSLEINRRRLD